MLMLWTVLIAASSAQKVFESTEDIGPEAFQNVTTLYPIHHNTNQTREDKQQNQISEVENKVANNETNSKEDKSKIDATIWKVDAAFADPNLGDKEQENITKGTAYKKNIDTKEFKPSQHLGNFYDEDNFRITPTKSSSESFVPFRKPAGVVSTKDDFRSSFNNIPKQILQTHTQYPYKFETSTLTRLKDPWKHANQDSLETKPTLESPVRIPAGGFYQYEDPFKEKPGHSYGYDELFKEKPTFSTSHEAPFHERPGSNEEFGLSFIEGGKDGENAVTKRVNPWESFLRLVTAFLPVGLIISALTPNLITIENAGVQSHGNTYPSNLYRRAAALAPPALAEPAGPAPPSISERCRRRLLCELHSDRYFADQNFPQRRGKNCYKIRCEDTEALATTLQWLLEYRRTHTGHYT